MPESNQPRRPAPQVDPVFIWPTPNNADLLFWVEKDARLAENETWNFGQAYSEDPVAYPDHKLIYVAPQDAEHWSRWFYMSDRVNEDAYNWELNKGNELVRTYIVPRALYRQKPVGAPGLLPGEFTYPPAATADVTFTAYGFADDTQVRTETELDSLYVLIRRRFVEPVTEEVKFIEEYKRYVRIKKELIQPAVSPPAPPAPANGTRVDYLHGSIFHDVKITSTILHNSEGPGISWQVDNLYGSQNFRFPSQLLSPVRIVYAAAWADSSEAAASYSSDFFFKYNIRDPRTGPFSTISEVYFTDDPETILAANPVTTIPAPQRESITVAYAWFFASTKGNSTQAYAKEWEVPSTVHGEVTVGNEAVGGSPAPSLGTLLQSFNEGADLAATPGFAAFAAMSEIIIDATAVPVDFGLHKVTIVRMNITGLYA